MTGQTPNVREPIFPKISQERIGELEAMLPEKPVGMGHPASDRDAWNKLASTPDARAFIKLAAPLLDEPFPEFSDELYLEFGRNGNRSNYENVHDKRLATINALALAECLEYGGRFLPKLEQCLADYLTQKSWVLPAHDLALLNFNDERPFPDLASSYATSVFAYIDWFLQDRLSPRMRAMIRKETMHRAIAPYQRVIRGLTDKSETETFWTVGINNWNAVCTCNLLSACFVLLESRHERAEILAAMELSNKRFYKGFTSDGYCSEGLVYWAYGFGHFLEMAEIVLAATNNRLNLFNDDPVLRKCCEFPRNIMIELGVSPAYADSDISNKAGDGNLTIIQRHFPELPPYPVSYMPLPRSLDEFRFSGRSIRDVGLFGFSNDTPAAPASTPSLPPVSFFSEAGVLVCRSTDGLGNRFGASIKGGHNNELHNHNDVGSYVIVVNKRQLVGDYGGEVYTRRTFSDDRYLSKMLNSYGHDVPVVAGELQMTGPEARGLICGTSFTDEITTLEIDMTSCYDVKELISLKRQFTFENMKRRAVVTDTVEFATPQTFEDAIISNAACRIDSKSRIHFSCENSNLTASISVTGADWTVESDFIENAGRISPSRFGIKLDRPVLKATVVCEFE